MMPVESGQNRFIRTTLIRKGVISFKNTGQRITAALHVVFAPWQITYDPIAELLRADDSTNACATTVTSTMSPADRLTSSWTERKLQELSYVGITVCN